MNVQRYEEHARMQNWEYCRIDVTLYREGSGGGTRELLAITRPAEHPTSMTHPLGSMGLLNQLGAEGWELVDVEAGVLFLKRPTKK